MARKQGRGKIRKNAGIKTYSSAQWNLRTQRNAIENPMCLFLGYGNKLAVPVERDRPLCVPLFSGCLMEEQSTVRERMDA